MEKNSKIYIAGHNGLVGSAIVKSLQSKGYNNLVFRNFSDLDLTNQAATAAFFAEEKPEYVFLAAAKVGGIMANTTYRGEFIYDNIMIQNNVIHQSYLNGVKKLLFLGSTCIYPKEAPQPMQEDALLTSPLEYTNEPYAIAKIAGIKLCESYNLQYGTNFLSVMPTNLYGPNDNFDLEKSHVLPALMRKIHLGKLLDEGDLAAVADDLWGKGEKGKLEKGILEELETYGVRKGSVEIWGTGRPMREFLWSEEMADACVFVMERVDFGEVAGGRKVEKSKSRKVGEVRNTHINIGTGKEISIKDLAYLIKDVVGFKGELVFDTSKPDGTMRKLTDVTKLHSLGWHHKIEIEEGVRRLYDWYLG